MTLLALLFVILMAQAPAAPTPEPGLSAPNLEKLRKITLSASKASNLDAPVARILGLVRDTDAHTGPLGMSVKQFKAETALGLYVVTVPVKPGSDDVLFSFRDLSGVTYTYLSDSSRTLRAAMASDADGNRALTKEEAVDGFQNSLKAWNAIAPRVKFP